jgi:hypothetical protein
MEAKIKSTYLGEFVAYKPKAKSQKPNLSPTKHQNVWR